jgi:peptidoglycan/xylan/chitin deacetylase (PgdA/CDA1 family)
MMPIPPIPILAYHQIMAENPPEELVFAMSVSLFEKQIRYLYEKKYICLSLSDIFDLSGGKYAHGHKTFALTFDDGYENFYTLAYPILRDYGFTATIFLIAGKTYRKDDPQREKDKRYLTWEQINFLDQSNFSFGSHTCSHRKLTGLPPEEIQKELADSKTYLESGLEKPIEWLAYPYGESNSHIQKMTENIGYRAAFGGYRGRTNWFDIRRQFCRRDDSLAVFSFRLNRFYYYFQRLRDETTMGDFFRKVKHNLDFRKREKK